MKSLFEYTDKLNKPYECFFLDVKKEWLPVQPALALFYGNSICNKGHRPDVSE